MYFWERSKANLHVKIRILFYNFLTLREFIRDPFLFDPASHLFDPAPHLFDPLAYLFDPAAYLFDSVAYLFDPLAYPFDPVAHLFASVVDDLLHRRANFLTPWSLKDFRTRCPSQTLPKHIAINTTTEAKTILMI